MRLFALVFALSLIACKSKDAADPQTWIPKLEDRDPKIRVQAELATARECRVGESQGAFNVSAFQQQVREFQSFTDYYRRLGRIPVGRLIGDRRRVRPL